MVAKICAQEGWGKGGRSERVMGGRVGVNGRDGWVGDRGA